MHYVLLKPDITLGLLLYLVFQTAFCSGYIHYFLVDISTIFYIKKK